MTEELEEQLVKKYPKLYVDHRGDILETPMHFGMCIGDGWYEILDELSAAIEPLGAQALQVKEKWGGLRMYVYVDGSEDDFNEVHRLINEAEEKSFTICEVCGAPGKDGARGGWIKTLCEKHWAEREGI